MDPSKKNLLLWCYYPHWSRDSVSPVCMLYVHVCFSRMLDIHITNSYKQTLRSTDRQTSHPIGAIGLRAGKKVAVKTYSVKGLFALYVCFCNLYISMKAMFSIDSIEKTCSYVYTL